MGTPQKFTLPSPNFNKKTPQSLAVKPHFLTPSGMTLHTRHQPPPMYGKRGATYPGKFLQSAYINNKFTASVAAEPVFAEPQFCEACDMEFQSIDDMRRHKSQHEKCPVDSCNYRGHPSVLDKHVATLHSSGLFDKFKKLSSPEEIAAWREERKRKYPTVENSLMRQRAKEQREKRGERLEGNKSRFGKYDDRKRAQNNIDKSNENQRGKINQHHNSKPRNVHTKRNNKRRRKEDKQKFEEKKQNEEIEKMKKAKNIDGPIMEDAKDEDDKSCAGIYAFKGTSRLSNYQHFKPKETKEVNVLSSLVGMYGSDEGSEDDSNADEIISDDEVSSLCRLEPKDIIDNSELDTNCTESSLQTSTVLCLDLHPNIHHINVVTLENDVIVKTANGLEENVDAVQFTKSENDTSKSLKQEHDSTLHKSNEEEFPCSDDEAPEEAPIARSTELPTPSKRTKPIENITNNASSQFQTSKSTKTSKILRSHKQKSGLDYRKARLRKQNTLLEKLLEPDIRHERNVLLQCVRYVCENQFFGIGQKKDQTN